MLRSDRFRACGLVVLSALACFATSAEADEPGPYEHFKWVTVQIDSPKTLLALSQLGEPLVCQAGPGPTDFAIAPDAMPALEALNIPFVIRSDNIQHEIDQETLVNELARAERGPDFFATYRTIGEIWAYLDVLAALDTVPNPPGHIIEKFNAGDSIQGRNIYGLRIATPTPLGAPPKPVFLISATQHAREWAAAHVRVGERRSALP